MHAAQNWKKKGDWPVLRKEKQGPRRPFGVLPRRRHVGGGLPSIRPLGKNLLPSTGQAPLPKKPSGKETTLGLWGERRKKDMEREEAG